MNILIKLTCLIGLVIAPILGNGTAPEGEGACCAGDKTEMTCSEGEMEGCDMSKCATMTKDECAAMCDEKGCSAEQKEKCMAMYDADGKFIGEGTTTTDSKIDADGNYIYDLGENVSFKLPNGTSLNVGKLSSENKLFTFLSDAAAKVDTDKSKGWISLDRTYFVSGKSELTEKSKEQVANLAAILKAYPNAKIKLGGYTDNTGALDLNKKISAERATYVKSQLEKAGVAAGRIVAEGYGPEHPVCTANDTKECQAQNRRVDIRVTNK